MIALLPGEIDSEAEEEKGEGQTLLRYTGYSIT